VSLDTRRDLAVLSQRDLEVSVCACILESHIALRIELMRLVLRSDLANQSQDLCTRQRLFHHWTRYVLDGQRRDLALGKNESGRVVGDEKIEKAI